MTEPTIILSDHAEKQLARRKLERAWVERTVLEPESTEPDPQHPERTRAYRALPERDGRVLRVVYVVQSVLTYRVVTTFLDRGRRRNRGEAGV